jgi:hypothetical protein
MKSLTIILSFIGGAFAPTLENHGLESWWGEIQGC